MASQDKTQFKPDGSYIFKWQYKPSYRLIGSETQTVPDMVLSMKDIYQRYAVTGDITLLPGSVRPMNFDPDDDNYPVTDAEDFTDVLQVSRSLRMDLEDQDKEDPGDEHPDEEPKDVGAEGDEDAGDDSGDHSSDQA